MRILVYGAILLLVVLGCESDFNPKGPFYDRMVVYSVLSPGSTTQFARVFTTYNPPGFNPLESTASNQVANATVSIASGASLFMFHETTFVRTDLSRYQDSVRAFVASPVNLVRGNTYALTVVSPSYGTVTASMTIPGADGSIAVDPSSLPALTQPGLISNDIFVFATPSESGQGHLIQVYLEYEIAAVPGVYMREEIPVKITNYRDCLTFDAVYPEIRRRQSGSADELWTFPHLNYQRIILKILKQHEGQIVNFRRVIFNLTQADQNLYSYLSLVNGFRDEFSIRVDRPNYTNVQGGLGLFGSFAADSIAINVGPMFSGLTCPQ